MWYCYFCMQRDNGVSGNAVTPFLLRTVDELLGGKALTASILCNISPSLYEMDFVYYLGPII